MLATDLTAVISFIGVSTQLGGELLLVLLFMLLRRYVLRRGYFAAWTAAWACGAVAILAVCVRYGIMPNLVQRPIDESSFPVRALYLAYQAGKLCSFALFVSGTAMYVTGARMLSAKTPVVLVAIAYAAISLVGAGSSQALSQLVVWQAPVAVVSLGACAALLFTLPRSRRTLGSVGAGAGFAALGMLWLLYGVAFGLVGSRPVEPSWVSAVVNGNTYFDLLLNIALGFGMVVLLMEDAKREVDDAQAELRVAHDQLRRAAMYDPLTDSLNRRAFEQGVGLEMARGTFGTVVIADLDNLKPVNDAFGHAAGDRLLRQCADLLRSTLRPYDKLYRWGGDEFLLVIPSARGADVEQRLSEVLSRAERLEVGGGGEVQLEVSLGTADYTSAESLAEAIDLADQAMYRQKHMRKSPEHGLKAVRVSKPVPADY
ncbi:MAG TPA: GGDEF domain-containing protein [Gemmatimonadaceae bacterium]|nr:GGDEF domain-containing protein [Gemmatimonadaceae bacterium]